MPAGETSPAFFVYNKMIFGPPNWLMMIDALIGSDFLTRTGYISRLS